MKQDCGSIPVFVGFEGLDKWKGDRGKGGVRPLAWATFGPPFLILVENIERIATIES